MGSIPTAGIRFGGVVRGLWHAHIGWLFETNGQAEKRRYCPDLASDPVMRRINRGFPLIVLATLAVPFLAGLAWGGTLDAGLEALLWAGLVRIFLVHHVTWSINSICHFFGARRFETGDHSTNVFWLALPSLGEAWHHNHHAFPRSAFHGLRWYELDPSGWLIMAMAKLGPGLGRRAHRSRDPARQARPRARRRARDRLTPGGGRRASRRPQRSRACAASRTSGASSSRSPAARR